MGGIDDIIDQSANSRTLAPAAVGSQVALMTLISGITIIVFNVLRPRNKIVYEPKVKYHEGDKQPPRISDSIFGWISPLVHTKEPVLVEKIGLDAAIYLRFLRMMRWIFTCIALLTSAALIPINIVNSLKNSKKHDDLSVLTIRDVSGDILFVHVAVTYLICFIVMGFVWFNWRAVIKLRSEWFRSPEYVKSFYARTLMITGVSRKLQSDEGLRAIFQSTQAPYPTTAVHIGRQVGKLPDLIEYHNEAVRELEKVLVKYLKNGRIGKQRPTVRVNGFMCFGGQKKDAIEFWTAKVQRAERAVEEYRNQIDTRKPEPYGFASMAAVPYAHTVANMLRNKRVKGATITLAPNPKDIIWMNLNATSGELASKKATGWIFLVLVCFFNTIPLFIISILANLASLTAFVPFLASWQSSSPGTFDFLSGVLPPAVSALFGFFLPILMRWLSKYQGAITHSRLDRAVIARYFAFLVISQLIIFTLIGVIFNSVREIVEQIGEHKSFQDIINNLHRLPDTINRTYIDQSSYWLTYFPLRGFLVFFDLAQIFNLLFISFKKHFLGRTPREIREWTQPPEFQYAIYYSNILFMGTVGLVFAPLAPLVCIAAAIVMWISSWVYKYQLMFVFVTRVETGGRLWNVIVNRLFVGVILMQLLMVLTIGLQKGWTSYYWISTIPPVLIVLGFKIYCTRVFNPRFNYYQPTPDELSVAQRLASQSESSGNNSRLSKRFGHPALHQELFTPMVHANMTALLPEVYRGKISNTSTKLDEYGGTKVDASMVAGIKIAAIEQHDLEYDPALYSRDRGELDWDARSVNSVNLLAPSKSEYGGYGGRASPAPSTIANYDKYLAQGPHSEIELNRMDIDQLPLLTSQQGMPWASASSASVGSLPYQQPPMRESPPPVPYIPQTQEYTEATLHRPYPTGQTGYPPPQPLQQHQQQPSGEMNMAGRGARRNMY